MMRLIIGFSALLCLLAGCGTAPTPTISVAPTETRTAELTAVAAALQPTATPTVPPTATATAIPPTPTAIPIVAATATPAGTATPVAMSAAAYVGEVADAQQLIGDYMLAIINACGAQGTMVGCTNAYTENAPRYREQARRLRALVPPVMCRQLHYAYLTELTYADELLDALGIAISQYSPSKVIAAENDHLTPLTQAVNRVTDQIHKGDCR